MYANDPELLRLKETAEKQTTHHGNTKQYLTEAGRKKYLRDHVMQALKAILPPH
jgi:hypothetical protein